MQLSSPRFYKSTKSANEWSSNLDISPTAIFYPLPKEYSRHIEHAIDTPYFDLCTKPTNQKFKTLWVRRQIANCP